LKAISVMVILIVSGVGVVVAITLLTHAFPAHTPPAAVVSSACANLVVQDEIAGWVRYHCASAPALTASAGTATATITGFSGYDDLYIVQGTPTVSCILGTTASKRLDPGPTAVTFGGAGNPPTGDWNYCADYSTLTSKPTFTVAWTQ
jgi:hypothetical protein